MGKEPIRRVTVNVGGGEHSEDESERGGEELRKDSWMKWKRTWSWLDVAVKKNYKNKVTQSIKSRTCSVQLQPTCRQSISM